VVAIWEQQRPSHLCRDHVPISWQCWLAYRNTSLFSVHASWSCSQHCFRQLFHHHISIRVTYVYERASVTYSDAKPLSFAISIYWYPSFASFNPQCLSSSFGCSALFDELPHWCLPRLVRIAAVNLDSYSIVMKFKYDVVVRSYLLSSQGLISFDDDVLS
jgi:hypothetical protein